MTHPVFGPISEAQHRDFLNDSDGDGYLANGAWFGSQGVKDAVVRKLHQHRADDEFIQRDYQAKKSRLQPALDLSDVEDWDPKDLVYKGCALGCMVPIRVDVINEEAPLPFYLLDDQGVSMEYCDEVEMRFGIDRDVAELLDETFEAQNGFEAAGAFAVASVEAIPVGADLSEVYSQFRSRLTEHLRNYGQVMSIRARTEALLDELRRAPIFANVGDQS